MRIFMRWEFWLGLTLLSLSAFFYELHYFLFRDARHILIYLIGDIAFVFIEVLLVTLVIHRLLAVREKRALMKKMNMVIGAFFSEVGNPLLRLFPEPEIPPDDRARYLIVKKDWSSRDFKDAQKRSAAFFSGATGRPVDLARLKAFLVSKRQFLLGLLENPNLLEHESFTNLLWSVFHLTEELSERGELKDLPRADVEHLSGDIARVNGYLVYEWLAYLAHLRYQYPYLFSLAARTNPFDRNASVVIR